MALKKVEIFPQTCALCMGNTEANRGFRAKKEQDLAQCWIGCAYQHLLSCPCTFVPT